MTYKPLRDYGLIGDMRTAALVGRDGSIDWCCFPRFDGPSVFAALLDARRGGSWSVAPVRGGASGAQGYEPGTNVLRTTFADEGRALELLDFMPVYRQESRIPLEIHRRVVATGGDAEVEVRFRPRFDYARSRTVFSARRHGVLATDSSDETLTLACRGPVEWSVDEGTQEARARLRLRAGEARWLVLRYDDDEVRRIEEYGSDAKLQATRDYWREWSAGLRYDGAYREAVERSALVLKLMVHAPTGAIVAAPTTSLPEEVGGERNWDYRYSWLRDSTFALFSLHALGSYRELDAYMEYLKRVCRQRTDFLQIMYGVGGELELPEQILEHLEGYRGSAPVRVGNAAVQQLQLDVYGELMDSVHIWRRRNGMTEGMWELCRRLADQVCDLWRRPDAGAWEMRGPPRHFVFSKVMCWVALDRAIRAAEDLGLEADVGRWRAERDAIHGQVLERGWSAERGAFVQHFETDRMDAANLALSMVRFLPADDPRILGTIERIEEELGHPSGLVYRYCGDDGLPGGEGTFCVNTFQLAQALALAGRRARAVEVFENVLGYASPLGLLSEEIDPDTGELLGNYPQAYSHIGLINAAHVIARTRPGQTATFALLPDD